MKLQLHLSLTLALIIGFGVISPVVGLPLDDSLPDAPIELDLSGENDRSMSAFDAPKRPLPVRPFTESLTSTTDNPISIQHKAPERFTIPDGSGPLRWSCIYSQKNVVTTSLGTQMLITRSDSKPVHAHSKNKKDAHPTRPYNCAEMVSKGRGIGYGKYSVEMISSGVKGHVTSIFLITPHNSKGSEIDIELTGIDPTVVWFNVWKGVTQHPTKILLGFDSSKDWHQYAVEWQPEFIAWSIDGKEVLRKTNMETVDPRKPGTEYELRMNSWTHDQEDHWAGRFEWPEGRQQPVMAQFRNLKFIPADL
ncbi:hypothetical protein FBU30_007295 [Linnemannia zychae]|nr:hypothetical protein FBU30_007295 [Linnemannia zychae]